MLAWLARMLGRPTPRAGSTRELPRREIALRVASGDGFADSEVIDAATGERLVFAGQYRWHMRIRPGEAKANVYLEVLDVPVGPVRS